MNEVHVEQIWTIFAPVFKEWHNIIDDLLSILNFIILIVLSPLLNMFNHNIFFIVQALSNSDQKSLKKYQK